MTAGQMKGALLEYLIRRLLSSCGFTSVRPDGHYIFAQNGTGLFFINGKGAAHDADTLMEPPIQMPFSYPSRLLFECKSYGKSTGLGVVRNAIGLRYDINEFEIVTDATINQRKNNRRANYAIADRKRYNYQVGIASVNEFSKPAFEFAANNKIPLISLRWFLSERVCNLFSDINDTYLQGIPEITRKTLYAFFKDKGKHTWNDPKYEDVIEFIERDDLIGEIISYFNVVINRSYVGLLESGDLIFLFANQTNSFELLSNQITFQGLRAQIHYNSNTPDIWELEIIAGDSRSVEVSHPRLKFYVPNRIMNRWKQYSLDKDVALDIKAENFSRIFIFIRNQSPTSLPFFVVNIDENWLNNLRE